MPKLRNIDLAYWYKRFNRRFFENKLPIIPVRFRRVSTLAYAETDITCKSKRPVEIRVSPVLRPFSKIAISSLLHEMCHVSNAVKYKTIRCGHGPRFIKELERICREGAYTRYNGGIL